MRRYGQLACSLLLAVAGCDPGLSFTVPGAMVVMDQGREFELAGPSQTTLRAQASVFTVTLSVGLTIINSGDSPLTIRHASLEALNQDGAAIARKSGGPEPACEHDAQAEEIVLPPGADCRLKGRFEANPDDYRLDTLTLLHAGVTRADVPIPISVVFEKE
ncbi:MAG: hypothetical protein SFX73_32280 [Kofleriaceae bacterium]|nr:hypothetical protein [Kofleriaceae bacterium]